MGNSLTDEEKTEPVRDAAGAMVRPVITEKFIPEKVHHRMTREFCDFAGMIDRRDHKTAEYYSMETLEVMRLVSQLSK